MALFRFALFAIFSTFVLLVIGGTVNPTGSSLACPDWPLCYGQFFPEMKDGVEFEHTHRLAGTFVGFVIMGLTIWIWRVKQDTNLRILAVVAFVLVCVQGVLGGITVILKLPLLVSTGHMALANFFLLFLIYIAFRLWPGRAQPTTPISDETKPTPKRGLVLITGLVIYAQIMLGAFVRHTKSGRVCDNDWLFCKGALWPSWAPQQLHMLHRFVGIIALALVIVSVAVAIRAAKQHDRRLVKIAAMIAAHLMPLQIVLGALTVRSYIGLWEVSLHLALGILILASFAVMYLGLGPQPLRVRTDESVAGKSTNQALSPGGVT